MKFNASDFLESLSNLKNVDYMHAHASINPDFFLKRTRWLIQQLPLITNYLKTVSIIHITGTSGKGTTGAILQSIIAQKKFVGYYNSPHVNTIFERIRIQKGSKTTDITEKQFNSITLKLIPILQKALLFSPYGLPSYFEITFAAALWHFAQMQCPIIILEVGCGGRYDATNIIPKSTLAIITNIGLDHIHIIGPTKRNIAYEKAGIIKPKSIVLIGKQISPFLQKIIKKETVSKKAFFIRCADPNQDPNIALASHAARLLGYLQNDITTGINNYVPLPGRFEILQETPLVIFDGAHNPDKIAYLLNKVKSQIELVHYKKKTLIFASCDGKNWKKMLQQLLPFFDKFVITRHNVLHRANANLKEMYTFLLKHNKQSTIFLSPEMAILNVLKNAGPKDFVLATGSLYLIGDLKKTYKL